MHCKVFLRSMRISDAQLVTEWENNTEWNQTGVRYSVVDILNLIHEMKNTQTSKQARWIICLEETEREIGVVDIVDIDFDAKSGIVGVFIVNMKDRRKGMASSALTLLERESKLLGINRLLSNIKLNNEPSIKLFESIGYRRNDNLSIMKDQDFVSMYKEL